MRDWSKPDGVVALLKLCREWLLESEATAPRGRALSHLTAALTILEQERKPTGPREEES